MSVEKVKATNNRRRTATFAERREYPLRLSPALYQNLTAACDQSGITTTAYVSTILELTLAESGKRDGLMEWRDRKLPGEAPVHLTLRMAPSLYDGVQAAAKTHGVTMSRFVTWAIDRIING